ncbi:cold-shock protein [Roseobacter sp. GAI101]|uniref:cold-shock protein n=1 Tax=Roseobacter sp. (strain GAI101) TaxID=391589 RepID=UPI0001871BB9|nr:cold shock domain-containing protein [Roseobacter sp. GAI101]EEB85772.1 cold shock protein [Roseobacter sp. GAI101]
MSEEENNNAVTTGLVKWFDPAKGFGFVVSDEGGPDILLHVNVLRNYGQSSVADGARIELTAHETQRGVQATQVHAIYPPQMPQTALLSDIVGVDPDIVAAAPIEPARVKWFDKSKGFGFANVFGRSDDIFLHIEVLRQSGLSDLQPGEALALRVIMGERGHMAAEVHAWETVTIDETGQAQS